MGSLQFGSESIFVLLLIMGEEQCLFGGNWVLYFEFLTSNVCVGGRVICSLYGILHHVIDLNFEGLRGDGVGVWRRPFLPTLGHM